MNGLNQMLTQLYTKLTNFYTDAKAFFAYSETILWARLQALVGFFTGVWNSLDFSALQSFDWQHAFENNNLAWVAFGVFANGLFTEYLRRRNSDI